MIKLSILTIFHVYISKVIHIPFARFRRTRSGASLVFAFSATAAFAFFSTSLRTSTSWPAKLKHIEDS